MSNMDVIQTKLAYETSDGEKFHDLAQAQGHARRRLMDGLYLHAAKQDVQFAALPRELVLDFLLKHSKDIAKVHGLTLAPDALSGEDARLGGASAQNTPQAPAAIVRAERPFAAPAPDKFASAKTFPEGGIVMSASPARPFPPSTEPQRLQAAMRAVDHNEEQKRRDAAIEAEAARVLEAAI